MNSPVLFYVILVILLISSFTFLLQAAAMAGKNKTTYAALYLILGLALITALTFIGISGVETAEEMREQQRQELCIEAGGIYYDDLCHDINKAPKIEINLP